MCVYYAVFGVINDAAAAANADDDDDHIGRGICVPCSGRPSVRLWARSSQKVCWHDILK